MQDYYNIRINFKGGLTSPQELTKILQVAQQNHAVFVRFGLRQQLFVHIRHTLAPRFTEGMRSIGVDFDADADVHPNIISSYAGEDVFEEANWLTEGVFKSLFKEFNYKPKLKINLSDNKQSFTPYFSGHLNFVASDIENYWYFTVRIPKSNGVYGYKNLIQTTDIVQVSKALEKLFDENEVQQNQLSTVWECIEQNAKTIPQTEPLPLHDFRLPYYEGFNRYSNKSWLGVYRRDENFRIDFLLELCAICDEAGINEICITPWKTIIIKNIEEETRPKISALLAKFNINVRHAANELNWQVEDDSDDALNLKRRIVNFFDAIDLRTFGIAFGIKTKPKTEVFASIMVRRRYYNLFGVLPLFFVYDISYTKDFDPNGRSKIYFATNVLRINLYKKMLEMVEFYNESVAKSPQEGRIIGKLE